jgi:hypothetical protein
MRFRPASRRFRLPAAVAALAAAMAAAALASCGGGDSNGTSGTKGEASTSDQPVAAQAANFPRPSNRSFRGVIGNLAQGPVLAPSVTLLEPGRDRFGFALFDRGNRQIGELQVALYVAKGVDETAHGPFPARYQPIDVKPQFQSRTSAEDPDAAHAVYVADVSFPSAGSYLVSAVAKLDRRLVATSPAQVTVRSNSPVPGVGDKAIRVHTPTVASAHGNVKSIDTRVPPDDMHDVDLADALDRHRPAILLFATPALCQSRVCGPVADVTAQVKAELGDRIDFIHMEIYKDNDLSKGPRPQFRAWHLRNEPVLFAIDKRGVVVDRLEGAFSVPELEAAARKALP